MVALMQKAAMTVWSGIEKLSCGMTTSLLTDQLFLKVLLN